MPIVTTRDVSQYGTGTARGLMRVANGSGRLRRYRLLAVSENPTEAERFAQFVFETEQGRRVMFEVCARPGLMDIRRVKPAEMKAAESETGWAETPEVRGTFVPFVYYSLEDEGIRLILVLHYGDSGRPGEDLIFIVREQPGPNGWTEFKTKPLLH